MAVAIYATQVLGLPQIFAQQESYDMYSPIPDLSAEPVTIEPTLVRNRAFDFNPIYRMWIERDERKEGNKYSMDQV